MAPSFRIDKLYLTAEKAVDVVFVIRRDGGISQAAWIANDETRRALDESADDLVQRALSQYRAKHPRENTVRTLIVDCSRQP